MKREPKISVILTAYNSADYIGGIINAVRQQSFTAFECIIINAGSTDNTGETVRELIAEDDRFMLSEQSSHSFSSARNSGIEQASGEYLVFFDAPDSVPAGALASLHRAAKKTDADLAIGQICYSDMGQIHSVQPDDDLSRKELIHPYDRDLADSPTICNKLFRRSVIADNNISFTDDHPCEDLQFCLRFLSKCRTITGCRDTVYKHERRLDSTDAFTPMGKDMGYLNGILDSAEKCKEAVAEGYQTRRRDMSGCGDIELKELDTLYDRLTSALNSRCARADLIDKIYRYAWTADTEVIDRICELIPQKKKQIFPMDWKEYVLDRSADLPYENGNLVSIDELEKRTVVAFAISGPEDPEKLNNVVRCIYSQRFPLFEVFIREDLYGKLETEYKNMRNLHSLSVSDEEFKDKAFQSSRGRYIWFIDQPVYLAGTSVTDMIAVMESGENYLFVSAPVISRCDGEYASVRANAASFINEYAKRYLRTEYNQLDYLWCNKLFSMAKLKSMKDPFGQGDYETIDRFYVRSNYTKTNALSLLTEFTDDDVLQFVKSNTVKSTWEAKLKEEEDFQESLVLREERVRGGVGKKAGRRRLWRIFYRWATVKVIYPLLYMLFKLKPVVKGKVLFVEPTQLEPTNSMKEMIKAVRDAGYDNIIQMSLGKNKLRRKYQLERGIKFVKEFATAEYVFTTEALAAVGGIKKRKETTFVQLWHGCGAFKKFGFSTADLLFGGDLQEKLRYPDYSNLDLITVSSPDVIWAYEEAMNYKNAGVVQATGISRTDVFFDENFVAEARNRIFETVPEAKGKKIILYAPTFRGRVKRAQAPDELDIGKMYRALGDEYFLLIKHHPHIKVRPLVPAECADFARDVTTSATIDDLLCCTDICISDYSSLVFEYSLFGKPMIFFAYDLDEYNDWRGFYYDYDQLTPGPVVMSTDEIIRYIQNIDKVFDEEAVEEFRQKFMSSCDGHATERILKKIGILS